MVFFSILQNPELNIETIYLYKMDTGLQLFEARCQLLDVRIRCYGHVFVVKVYIVGYRGIFVLNE